FSSDKSFFIQDHKTLLGEIGGVFLIILGLNLIGVIKIPWLYRTYTLETATARVPAAASVGGSSGATAATMTMGGGPAGNGAGFAGRGWPDAFGYAKSFGVGSAFAIGWTPCIGPVLGAILTLSASTASVAKGSYLLLVYSLGLGVPFMITGLAVVPITRFLRRIRGIMPIVEITTGVLVIFVGILLFRGDLATFNGYFSDIPFLDRFNTI
ncbi:MAG TPA: cytochrome c biogenesis protein CcdA, partial [Dehalococcoidia bacterium]